MPKNNIILVTIISFLFLLFIPLGVEAQQMSTEKGIRIGFGGGYSRDLLLKNSNGAAVAPEVGFRLKCKHFLFDVGVGGQYMFTNNQVADIFKTLPGTDEEGVDYTGYHTWNHRVTNVNRIQVFVPIMLGGEWKKFNFLVGAKANASVWAVVQEQGLYTLTATYPRYIESFETMPRHGLVTDQPYYNPNQPVEKSIDIRVVAEVNYRVWANNKRTRACYIGAFAEYGVWHPVDWTPFVVGAKVTFLFWLKGKESCHCYEN